MIYLIVKNNMNNQSQYLMAIAITM